MDLRLPGVLVRSSCHKHSLSIRLETPVKERENMTTATEPTIVPPVTMLENLMTGLAAISDASDVEVLQSGIRDMIDEAARYQAMLTEGAQTGTGAVQGTDPTAAAIERVLEMLADTNTKTGSVLSILKKAGRLDDVSRGLALVPKAVKGAVTKRKVARKAKAKVVAKKAAARRRR
jgi:hypothetical protein